MSWESKLVEFYDANADHAGDYEFAAQRGQLPMMPVFAKSVPSSYEISISSSGDFIGARVIDKKDKTANILIQQTDASQSRTSDVMKQPAPFIDQIRFMAKDPEGIDKKVKDKKDSKKINIVPIDPAFYENYITNLRAWAESKQAHPYIRPLLTYLEKGTVVKDIMAVNGGKELDRSSFFRLVIDGKETWKDMEFHKAFQDYYLSSAPDAALCPITGVTQPPMKAGTASKIKGNSKFFSSNDGYGFTFRGDRYPDSSRLPMMGVATEQKLTAAYKWLRSYQSEGEYIFWGIDVIPWSNTNELCNGKGFVDEDDEEENESSEMNSCSHWAKEFTKYMAGYAAKIPQTDDVNVMRVKAFTDGRISIAAHYHYTVDEFYRIIRNWHVRGAWKQQYYYGVPKPADMVDALQTKNPNIESKKGSKDTAAELLTHELIQCMLHNRRVPFNLVHLASANLAKKASAVPHKEKKQDPRLLDIRGWENNMLSPLCSLTAAYYNYSIKDEENYYTMALDKENTNRSYLFGRLLACAHKVELDDGDGKKHKKHKTTNAMRLTNRFVSFPYSTWGILSAKLQPYLIRSKFQKNMTDRINDILELFAQEDFTAKKGLEPLWMLGYAAQMKDFYKSTKEKAADTKDDNQVEA